MKAVERVVITSESEYLQGFKGWRSHLGAKCGTVQWQRQLQDLVSKHFAFKRRRLTRIRVVHSLGNALSLLVVYTSSAERAIERVRTSRINIINRSHAPRTFRWWFSYKSNGYS